MLDSLARTRVGSEFVGQARVYRASIQAIDQRAHDALVDIAEPLRERLARKPRLRPEHVIEAIRAYRTMVPDECRIGELQGARHKTDFMLVDQRLMPSRLRHEDWGDEPTEPGITIAKLYFGTKDGKLVHHVRPCVALSLHSIARRIERAGADRAALFVDIAILSDLEGDIGEIIAPSGGRWLGSWVDADGDGRAIHILNIRTFVS